MDYYGERWTGIHHARLHMGCSSLKSDLFFNLHVTDNPSCLCGYPVENAFHFFLHCNLYRDIRTVLINSISNLTLCSIEHILYGDPQLSLTDNQTVFCAVHKYLKDSKRFN